MRLGPGVDRSTSCWFSHPTTRSSIRRKTGVDANDFHALTSVHTFPTFVGSNPFAWAKIYENTLATSSAHGHLELPCAVMSMNLSSVCLTKMRQTRLAFVEPIFTASAYQNDGFYSFYDRHANDLSNSRHVTTDLGMLNVTVINSEGSATGLSSFIGTYEQKNYFGNGHGYAE